MTSHPIDPSLVDTSPLSEAERAEMIAALVAEVARAEEVAL